MLDAIRADPEGRDVPAVVLTSSNQDVEVQRACRSADSFVRKPVSFEELERPVRMVGCYWLLLHERPR